MAAAVLLPASLVALRAERLLLAKAHGAEAVGGNAQRNDVLLNGGGAAIAEAQVVFRGAALVAVAFDGRFDRRVVLQEVRGLGERGTGIGTKVGLVVVEIGVAHLLEEELIKRGLRRRRRRRRRRVHRDARGGVRRTAGTGGGNRVRRRVGGSDLGRALSGHGANFGCDGELRGISGIPAQR